MNGKIFAYGLNSLLSSSLSLSLRSFHIRCLLSSVRNRVFFCELFFFHSDLKAWHSGVAEILILSVSINSPQKFKIKNKTANSQHSPMPIACTLHYTASACECRLCLGIRESSRNVVHTRIFWCMGKLRYERFFPFVFFFFFLEATNKNI